MKKWVSFLFLLIYSHTYSAQYLIEHNDNKIHVVAIFSSEDLKNTSNKIKLNIPEEFWGTSFSKKIKIIKTNGIYDAQSQVVTTDFQEDLKIVYDIIGTPKEKLIEKFPENYDHFIDKRKFYLFGFGLFIIPENLKEDRPITIQIKSKLKKVAYSQYPYFYESNIIKTTLSKLSRLIMLASNDLNISHKDNVDLIIWSEGKYLCKTFKKMALPAFTQQAEYWQDKDQQRKLAIIFSLSSAKDKGVRLGGNVQDESTVLFFTKIKKSKVVKVIEELKYVFKHENLHFWFGVLLGGPAWFREGFTEYYIDKIDLHYNKDGKAFTEKHNARLQEYFNSPARQCSDKEVDKYFFEIPYMQKLPYNKGYLIAAQIDSIIDLDKALKKMMSLCKKDKKYCVFNKENLIKCAGKLSSKQKIQITKLINDFNNAQLNKQLIPNTSLSQSEQKIYSFPIDVLKIWKERCIAGKELSIITGRIYPKEKYEIKCISTNFANGQGSIKIQNGKTQEKILLPSTLSTKHIPYYSYSQQ